MDAPRYLGMPLRRAVDELPVVDLAAMVRQIGLTPGTALNRLLLPDQWGPHEENTARLLEVVAYQLDLHWADRTFDADDPESRRRATEAKRVKPPPRPIIPPVAERPLERATQAWDRYIVALTEHGGRMPTLDDWDREHGLTDE